ncbi:hypothetical protein M3Y94_00981200 [Aphelenchoides besseyi]|nr:hypothetical protein M3Y94_00981200 [Aphelenchoides besseyi]KAI6221062.1 GST protein [Aphelenchoides besseyi]
MVVYKLIYFPVRNLAEPIRMLFHVKGQRFEDIRVNMDDWPKMKKDIPFGHLPCLEVNDKKLVQSQAILRFLGKRFKMAGHDQWEEARVDELADLYLDFHSGIRPYIYTVAGFEKGDDAQLKKSALLPTVEKFFPLYSKLLKQNGGSGFLVGKKLTFVDLQLADILFTIRTMAPEVFDRHLDLSSFIDRIYGHYFLKKYIAQRPATQI